MEKEKEGISRITSLVANPSTQQYPWMSTSTAMPSSAAMPSFATSASSSVASSSCSALPALIPLTNANPHPCGSEYGKQCGFGITTQRSKREKDETIKYVTMGCAHGGKARNRTSNVSKPRPTSKTNFKAMMNVLLKNRKLCVTSIFNTHNHVLSSRKSRFFRCNREVSESDKRILDTNDEADIQMNKSFQALVTDAGGFENVPFGKKDCRNYINKARHLRLGKDGVQTILEYFRMMQHKNDDFYGIMDLDARSRGAYDYFGDMMQLEMDGMQPSMAYGTQPASSLNATSGICYYLTMV
ncbi:hypothetical protein F2P56_030451 [Juglans regia]|uniref:FAR1 domain-containing protein n=2 Tax=Juglans regia TaxID=51240 RepID=A0A833U1E3_JUGRE|nr:uncharacterized protein LOC108991431 [Juglans regia]KAF5450072.1 hypothetical protein F2P56_030451 [Juglans regia]